MTTTALIHMLLHLFYSNACDIRHMLIAFYRHQQPGMPRGWYPRYVRFLIVHYPHAMHTCMNALHNSHGARGAGCP